MKRALSREEQCPHGKSGIVTFRHRQKSSRLYNLPVFTGFHPHFVDGNLNIARETICFNLPQIVFPVTLHGHLWRNVALPVLLAKPVNALLHKFITEFAGFVHEPQPVFLPSNARVINRTSACVGPSSQYTLIML